MSKIMGFVSPISTLLSWVDEFDYLTMSVDKELFGCHKMRPTEIIDKGELIIEVSVAGYPKEALKVLAYPTKIELSGCRVDDRRDDFNREIINDSSNKWDLQAASIEYKDGLMTFRIPPKVAKESKLLDIKT
jgi:HSP20 family molecular chaperone IbpA